MLETPDLIAYTNSHASYIYKQTQNPGTDKKRTDWRTDGLTNWRLVKYANMFYDVQIIRTLKNPWNIFKNPTHFLKKIRNLMLEKGRIEFSISFQQPG